MNSREQSKLGIRVPVGVNYIFEKIPVDLFFEIVPILNLIPATAFDLNIGIGAHFNIDFDNKK